MGTCNSSAAASSSRTTTPANNNNSRLVPVVTAAETAEMRRAEEDAERKRALVSRSARSGSSASPRPGSDVAKSRVVRSARSADSSPPPGAAPDAAKGRLTSRSARSGSSSSPRPQGLPTPPPPQRAAADDDALSTHAPALAVSESPSVPTAPHPTQLSPGQPASPVFGVMFGSSVGVASVQGSARKHSPLAAWCPTCGVPVGSGGDCSCERQRSVGSRLSRPRDLQRTRSAPGGGGACRAAGPWWSPDGADPPRPAGLCHRNGCSNSRPANSAFCCVHQCQLCPRVATGTRLPYCIRHKDAADVTAALDVFSQDFREEDGGRWAAARAAYQAVRDLVSTDEYPGIAASRRSSLAAAGDCDADSLGSSDRDLEDRAIAMMLERAVPAEDWLNSTGTTESSLPESPQ
eukprot:TRINITY_DN39141_c0_g1_i1.p1 TRINITY_DN39141_c0_g1~~TRINITY_DN39141_c0_g1_i1.p1  ORF type:complete len:406 (+),score=50.47 TRINITY_DN39141_c0_g1_i1:238-1455(+)